MTGGRRAVTSPRPPPAPVRVFHPLRTSRYQPDPSGGCGPGSPKPHDDRHTHTIWPGYPDPSTVIQVNRCSRVNRGVRSVAILDNRHSGFSRWSALAAASPHPALAMAEPASPGTDGLCSDRVATAEARHRRSITSSRACSSSSPYLRRDTRRAVRRPVRRATLLAPNTPILTPVGRCQAATWRACLVSAPAELSVVRTGQRNRPARPEREWPFS